MDSDTPEERQGQRDDFGIEGRIIRAQCFHPELLMLPVAPLLSTFVPEVRGAVKELADAARRIQGILDIGPQHRGRAFGPQGQRVAAFGDQRIHFFRDNIGCFPN